MKRLLLSKAAITVASFLSLSGFLLGCSSNSPLGSSDNSQVVATESPSFVSLLPVSSGDYGKLLLPMPVSELISASKGGSISNGYVSLQIPSGALEADTEISISMLRPGQMVFELEPHGIQFQRPVEMSFDNFSQNGDELKVYWFNDELGTWVVINSGFDDQSLTTDLSHFSGYGLTGG